MLTFDRLPAGDADVDAIELDVPRVTATALRNGLLNDAEARERLFGGSVTQDDHLLLVASLDDAALARSFAKRIGGDMKRASTTYGRREFVSGPLPVRLERGTLVVAGGADDDAITLDRARGPDRGHARRPRRSPSRGTRSTACASTAARASTRSRSTTGAWI